MELFNPRLKHAFSITAACIALFSFVQFLLFYVPFGFFYESRWLLILSSHLTNFFEAFFPVVAALIIFLTRENALKNKIVPCILISLTRLFYSVPYYYIYYVSDVFNSIEAIILAFLVSVLYISFFFLQTFICIFIINYIEKRAKKEACDREFAKLFNVDDHINFGIALSVIFVFVIFFIREAVSTVRYLIDNSGSYRTQEIVTIVFSYLLLFIFSFIHYIIAAFIKNRLLKNA